MNYNDVKGSNIPHSSLESRLFSLESRVMSLGASAFRM